MARLSWVPTWVATERATCRTTSSVVDIWLLERLEGPLLGTLVRPPPARPPPPRGPVGFGVTPGSPSTVPSTASSKPPPVDGASCPLGVPRSSGAADAGSARRCSISNADSRSTAVS